MGFVHEPMTWTNFAWLLLSGVLLFVIVLVFVTYVVYFERQVARRMQLSKVSNEVISSGLLHTVADVWKQLRKENSLPQNVDRPVFIFAPVLAFVPAFVVLAAIPYSERLYFADLDVGLLYYVALTSISMVGVLLSGWASNNHDALLGSIHSVAKMMSYQIPFVISVVGVTMLSGSLNLRTIVSEQGQWFWQWHFIPQAIGFCVFIIAGLAGLNRTLFDLSKARPMLVEGGRAEYSGFRYVLFMLAEYTYVLAIASLATVLFLGGWHAPAPMLVFIPGVVWFLLKFAVVVFFLIWMRAMLTRLRTNQLMNLGWKLLLPLALLNVFVTALYIELLR